MQLLHLISLINNGTNFYKAEINLVVGVSHTKAQSKFMRKFLAKINPIKISKIPFFGDIQFPRNTRILHHQII